MHWWVAAALDAQSKLTNASRAPQCALSGVKRSSALQKLYFDLDQIQSRHARATLNSGLAFGETAGAVEPSSVAAPSWVHRIMQTDILMHGQNWQLQANRRKAMAGLDDMIRSSVPGGNIGKPLMLALGALLASGVLFRGGGAGQTASAGSQPTSDEGTGGLLGGLGGLLNKLQQGGLGNETKSWVGSGQNQPVSPGQLGSALGPNIIKTLAQQSGISEDELTKQLSQILPGIVDKLTPNGRLPTAAELPEKM
jgi:uncharacterized protein YidB (DUF937 family)